MPAGDGLLTTDDRRTVQFWDGGDPAGPAVLVQPGTPASRLQAQHADRAARDRGVRLVSVNRPGYGRSTATPPGLMPVGEDAMRVADHLGLERLAVVGISGGGPYALATAVAGGSRVTSVGLLAGVGPWPTLDPPSADDREDRRMLARARAGDLEGAQADWSNVAQAAFHDLLALDDDAMMSRFLRGVRPEEAGLLTPHTRDTWAADLREALTSYDGFVRDNLSWGLPWDLDVREVRAPSHLWYGELDQLVPVSHGRWLADRLADADLLVLARSGHARVTLGTWPEVLRVLTRDPAG